jgi:hypothetical protein
VHTYQHRDLAQVVIQSSTLVQVSEFLHANNSSQHGRMSMKGRHTPVQSVAGFTNLRAVGKIHSHSLVFDTLLLQSNPHPANHAFGMVPSQQRATCLRITSVTKLFLRIGCGSYLCAYGQAPAPQSRKLCAQYGMVASNGMYISSAGIRKHLI